MREDIKNYILRSLHKETLLTTHHRSDFYSGFCDLTGREWHKFKANQRSIRYYLNKLVDEGYITKSNIGSGYGGVADGCGTHNNVWHHYNYIKYKE